MEREEDNRKIKITSKSIILCTIIYYVYTYIHKAMYMSYGYRQGKGQNEL